MIKKCSFSVEGIFLVWGIRLCIVVRKAPSEFNESRFISMAIYNEFILSVFLNISMYVLNGYLIFIQAYKFKSAFLFSGYSWRSPRILIYYTLFASATLSLPLPYYYA